MTTRAIRYHRFSSKRQDKGSSIERQDERTRELCERKGWAIADTIEDKGQSAWRGDHLSVGNLGRLRKEIDAGLIEPGTVLVVENLDRLSRQDYRTARRWIEDITDRGITVAVHTPELMLDREAMSGANIGPIIQHLLEANRATSESKRKSDFQQKNIARMLDQAREGIVNSPRAPQWLIGRTGDQEFGINENRAAIVRLIYEWSASGMGLGSICKKLNATYPAWGKGGWKTGKVEWRIGYVRDILRSPAVEGEYHVRRGLNREPTGEILRGYYPRIVDADLVARARAALNSRAGTGGQGAVEAKNLFVGLITCQTCGGAVGRSVTGNGRGGRYAYLRCRSSRYGNCANTFQMRYDHLETELLNSVLHLALDDTFFVAVDNVAPLVKALADARKGVEVLTHERTNLISVLSKLPDSTGIITALGEIEEKLKASVVEIERLKRELEVARGSATPEQHLARVRELRASIEDDDADVRAEARRKIAEAMRGLIDRIDYREGSAFVTAAGGKLALTVRQDGPSSTYDFLKPGTNSADPRYAERHAKAVEELADGRWNLSSR